MSEFDSTPQLTEGFDPTSTWGSFASGLLQLIRQATPASLYGFVIQSTDTPPVISPDEWRKRCLWYKPDYVKLDGTLGGIFYYSETLGSWDNFEKILNAYGVPLDGSVTIAKLSPAGGAPLQTYRINAGGTAIEWVTFADTLVDGTLSISKLAPRVPPAVDFMLLTDSSGLLQFQDFVARFGSQLFLSDIFTSQLVNDLGGVTGQVLSVGTAQEIRNSYVEDLLRLNKTPTNRLQYPAGIALKLLQGNSTGTDIQPADLSSIVTKVAILKDSKPSGTDGQVVLAGATDVVVLDIPGKVDPNGIVTNGGGNQFQLATGKYKIEVITPCMGNNNRASMQLYNVHGTTIVAANSIALDITTQATSHILMHAFTVTSVGVDDLFTIRFFNISGAASITLGLAATPVAYAETFTQVLITRYAD